MYNTDCVANIMTLIVKGGHHQICSWSRLSDRGGVFNGQKTTTFRTIPESV